MLKFGNKVHVTRYLPMYKYKPINSINIVNKNILTQKSFSTNKQSQNAPLNINTTDFYDSIVKTVKSHNKIHIKIIVGSVVCTGIVGYIYSDNIKKLFLL